MSRDRTVSLGERHGVRTCGLAQSRQEDPSGRGNGKESGGGRGVRGAGEDGRGVWRGKR